MLELDYGCLKLAPMLISGFMSAMTSFLKEFSQEIKRVMKIKCDIITLRLVKVFDELELLLIHDNNDRDINYVIIKAKELIYENDGLFNKKFENDLAKRRPLELKLSGIIEEHNNPISQAYFF